MSIIETLAAFFVQPKEESNGRVPEGYCPNCWGEQEYDQQVRDMFKDKQVDVNNHSANYAFIQEFVVTHLDGIHLKKGNNSLECPTCHVRYPEDELDSRP